MTLQDAATRLEFLKKRQLGIGGSDMGAILGVDPYRNAYDVYLEKTRPPTVEEAQNIHIIRGLVLEDIAADLYQEKTGRKVRRVKQRSHPDNEWATVNVDRQILRTNGTPTGALEIKAPYSSTFQRFLDEGAQEQHIVQLQWAMYVLGYEWGEYVAINLEHNAGPIIHFPLERNDDLIERCVDVATRFWDHVESRVPPTPDLWEYYSDPIEIPTEGLADHIVRYGQDREWDAQYEWALAAYGEYKNAESQYKAAKEELLKLAGESKVKVQGPQGSVSIYWSGGRPSFDDKRLKASMPLDFDAVYNLLALHQVHMSPVSLIEKCALDLSLFEKQGDPYQNVRVTPKKGT